jgi:lipoprotein-anchoring transpeptidase ErfK/SrfK
LAAVLVVIAAACGGGDSTASGPADESSTTTTTTVPPVPKTIVAEASQPTVTVYEEPDGAEKTTLDNPTDVGAPLVFVVETDDGSWLRVHLPIRPNGSTGWIQRGDATLSQHPYKVVVSLGAHRIQVYDGFDVILDEPIGVGTANRPTPTGYYYIKELLQPPDPTGPYGAYAFGLSGFSNALSSFAGGDAVIGIHGTNDPSSIGQDVSSGCIRMNNDAIAVLVERLPLGTPVEINA